MLLALPLLRPVPERLAVSARKGGRKVFKEVLETIIEHTEGSLGALIMGLDGIAVERSLKKEGQEANLDIAAAEFTSLVKNAQHAGKTQGSVAFANWWSLLMTQWS